MAERLRYAEPPKVAHKPFQCSECAFFADAVPLRMPTTCRVQGPQLVPVPGPGGQLATLGLWPPTESHDWCGKWTKRPTEYFPGALAVTDRSNSG